MFVVYEDMSMSFCCVMMLKGYCAYKLKGYGVVLMLIMAAYSVIVFCGVLAKRRMCLTV